MAHPQRAVVAIAASDDAVDVDLDHSAGPANTNLTRAVWNAGSTVATLDRASQSPADAPIEPIGRLHSVTVPLAPQSVALVRTSCR
jgi:hypothetical protein